MSMAIAMAVLVLGALGAARVLVAASGSPLWTCSAPQQPCAAGTSTLSPLCAITRAEASCVCGWVRGMMQPLSIATVALGAHAGSAATSGGE